MDLTQFRAYDPTLGRWWQVDPLASEMSSWTPYNYSFNNPIRFNDPLGDAPSAMMRIGNTDDSMGGEDQSEDKNKTYDGGTLPEHTVSAPRSFDGVLGRAADSWIRNNTENSTYGRKQEEGLGRETEWWSDTKQAIGYGYSAITTTMLSAFQAAEMGAEFASGNAAKGGMSELQLVTRAAQKAEAAIEGSGGVAGTLKHTYAKNLLIRYQSMYGGNLSLGSNYFNNNALLGPGNRGFLDAVNHNSKIIYDFKFGDAFMSNSQYLKYSRNYPGYRIQVIDKIKPK